MRSAASALVALLAGLPATAHACDCYARALWTLPGDGATVPTNTRLLELYETRAVLVGSTLRDESGAVVPVTSTVVYTGTFRWRESASVEPLLPGSYLFEDEFGRSYGTFTVIAHEDHDPPGAVAITAMRTESEYNDGDCAYVLAVRVEADSASDPSGVFYEFAFSGDETMSDPSVVRSGAPSAIQGTTGYCRTAGPLELGDTVCAQVRAVDAAGNTSDWSAVQCLVAGSDLPEVDRDPDRELTPDTSAEERVAPEPEVSCGCRSPGPLGPAAAPLLLLALRRRASRDPRRARARS